MFYLEKINKSKFQFIEFRPWPKAYQLGNKAAPELGGFICDETYYIGLRIKNTSTMKEMFSQVDLSEARIDFFKKLHDFISNPERSDNKYMENIDRKEVDIDIKLLSRAQLPDQVRPRIKERTVITATNPMETEGVYGQNNLGGVGQRRTFTEMDDQNNNQEEIVDFEFM